MHGGRGIVGEEAILSLRHDTQETLVGNKIENVERYEVRTEQGKQVYLENQRGCVCFGGGFI